MSNSVSVNSAMLSTEYTRNVQQQVMSPGTLSGHVITTVLVDATNFSPWLRRIEKFTANMKWREYFLSDDFAETRSVASISENEISYSIGVLQQGLSLLIMNSVSESIKEKIQVSYGRDENTNSRDVLIQLKECYSEMKMRGYAEFVGEYKYIQNKPVAEQAKWVTKRAAYMVKYAEPNKKDGNESLPEDKSAGLLMLTFHPEKIKRVTGFIGKRESVGIKEVTELTNDVTIIF